MSRAKLQRSPDGGRSAAVEQQYTSKRWKLWSIVVFMDDDDDDDDTQMYASVWPH